MELFVLSDFPMAVLIVVCYVVARVFSQYSLPLILRLFVHLSLILLLGEWMAYNQKIFCLVFLGKVTSDLTFTYISGFLCYCFAYSSIAVMVYYIGYQAEVKKFPIPLKALEFWRPMPPNMPLPCRNPDCDGDLVKTQLFCGETKTKLEDWQVEKVKQALGHDRIFCLKCGAEHVDIKTLAKNPLNLHELAKLIF